MTTPNTTPRSNHHPMMIVAAVAVVLFCLVGTAAIMGWIPSGGSGSASGELTASDRAALASQMAEGPEAQRERDRVAQVERDRQAKIERERNQDRRDSERAAAPAPRHAAPKHLAAATPAKAASNWCDNCGNVESVREVKTRAQGSGLGAAGGAVLGGLLGNQVGDGNGRKLATVAGAVGGAVVGNQVEGRMKATTTYEVIVRMDDGGSRTFNLESLDGFSSGDRIQVVNGALRHHAK